MDILGTTPTQPTAPPAKAVVTGNTLPILHEIRHALERLARDGDSTTLDLRAIPFAPGDEERLLAHLGRGEVRVELDAMGESNIWESNYPGVWVVQHRDEEGERVAFQIEITDIPSIIRSQPEDLEESLDRLASTLTHAAEQEPV